MRFQLFLLLGIILMLTSCIVQSPEYARFSNVLALEVGMSKAEVEEVLGFIMVAVPALILLMGLRL